MPIVALSFPLSPFKSLLILAPPAQYGKEKLLHHITSIYISETSKMPLSSTIPNPMPSHGSAAYLLAKAKFESLPNAQLPRARVRSMPGFVPLPVPTAAAKAAFESLPNVFVWEFKSHWSITRGGKAILLRGPLDTLDEIYAGFDTNEELGHYRDKTQARCNWDNMQAKISCYDWASPS